MLDDTLALANSGCLLALSLSDRLVLALLLRAGLIVPFVLCCACVMLDDNMLERIKKIARLERSIKKALFFLRSNGVGKRLAGK